MHLGRVIQVGTFSRSHECTVERCKAGDLVLHGMKFHNIFWALKHAKILQSL